MTAPLPPPPVEDPTVEVRISTTVEPDDDGRTPWAVTPFDARFAALPKVGRGARFFDVKDVKALFDDMREHIVADWRARVALADGKDRALQDRSRVWHENAALRERLDGHTTPGHPTVAVLAVAGGQGQGERIIAEATEEARRILAGARLQADEAAQRLREARDTAAAGPPVLALPVEPHPTGDTVADAVAVGEHIRACRDAIEAHRAALDDHQAAIDRQRLALDDQHDDLGDQERALVERRDGFVAEIDRIGDELPAVRDRVAAIDLPGAPAEVA
jgi:hypothetical protein